MAAYVSVICRAHLVFCVGPDAVIYSVRVWPTATFLEIHIPVMLAYCRRICVTVEVSSLG